jgi:ABC-2 type transport system ATP-binding protein
MMIVLDSVIKQYGKLKAVNHVSYQVKKGEFFALLGPNGAGKTTIIKMLMGFIRPTSGTLTINGVASHKTRARAGIGYVAEQHMIPPYLTGLEYLHRHASLAGLSTKDTGIEVERVLEKVSMSGKEKNKSGEYSKGMKQRIGLAGALLGSPELLVLDEPVSGLDPMGIQDIRKIIESLKLNGTTVVLNSHLLSEVEKICDTVGIIHQGELIVKNSIEQIVDQGQTLEDVFVKYVTKVRADA